MARRLLFPTGMLISVCMIARDEEATVSRCLDSTRGLADEIVFVDTGSTDGTPDLARRHAARVFHHPFNDDFAAARNAALDHARGRYVLVLDADEWVEDGADAEAVRRTLAESSDEAFSLTLRDHLDAGQERRYPLLRVFRNRPEYRYERAFHEQISPSIARALGVERVEPVALPVVLGHDGYTVERQAARDKPARNRRLLLTQVRSNPDDPAAYYFLARELVPLRGGRAIPGDHLREALEYCASAANRRSGLPPALDADLTRLHAAALLATGRAAEAADLLERTGRDCLAHRLLRAEAALAGAAGDPDRIAGVLDDLRSRFDRPDTHATLPAVELELAGPIVRARAAETLLCLGRLDEARDLARLATTLPGGGAAPWNALAAVERAADQPVAAIRAYLDALRLDRHDPWAWAGLGEMLLFEQPADAVEPLLNATRLAPGWDMAEEALAAAWILAGCASALDRHFGQATPVTSTARAAMTLAAADRDDAAPNLDRAAAASIRRILRRVAVAGRPDLTARLGSRLAGAAEPA